MADTVTVAGEESFARRAWARAHAELSAAEPLSGADLERFAEVAYLVGNDEQSTDLWARVYREQASADPARAARAAFWLVFGLLNRGEAARGGGWADRAQRLLDDNGLDCAEQGALRYLAGLRAVLGGDPVAARAAFAQAIKTGDRFGDAQLVTLARIGLGRCLIYLGETVEGLALLDEAMVAVTGGELAATVVGDAYCTVIEGCREVFELRRSQVWTAELTRWCDQAPSLVAYRGQCLVHRAEILQLRGVWDDAVAEARLACERLARDVAVGAAFYQLGELHRVRGEVADAESAYRRASEFGREPQPGLALLRLAQGRTEAAVAAIRRVVDEAQDPVSRARLLPACVEITVAAGDTEAAGRACRELEEISAGYRSDMMDAIVCCARGSVDLATGDARSALVTLRHAEGRWRSLDAPYEVARVRVLVGLACREVGDDDTADLELAAAAEVFARLGAAGDLARVRKFSGTGDTHGLTRRELEVLRLLSTGGSNKMIAAQLVLSERTVDRHVSSILNKLGVPSRSAATAYAYRHQLV